MRLVRHLLRLYTRWRLHASLTVLLLICPVLALLETNHGKRGLALIAILIGVLFVITEARETNRRLRARLAAVDPWSR